MEQSPDRASVSLAARSGFRGHPVDFKNCMKRAPYNLSARCVNVQSNVNAGRPFLKSRRRSCLGRGTAANDA